MDQLLHCAFLNLWAYMFCFRYENRWERLHAMTPAEPMGDQVKNL